MCEFVDDEDVSVFPFEDLQRCMVDSLEEWEDFAPFADNPFGSRPVWVGYRPVAQRRQRRVCGARAAGLSPGARLAFWSAVRWKGMDFATQAEIHTASSPRNATSSTSVSMRPPSVLASSSWFRSFYPAARDYPLHAGNENRNGAESEGRYPPWLYYEYDVPDRHRRRHLVYGYPQDHDQQRAQRHL
ncbi:hypothetical protein ACS19Z_05450 [Klebsiella pneumoniae]|uniref:hypothetical protein n=1 Tax=Klebsiella pneumoniae TaxID=573 RepID=UPI003F6CDE6A